MYKIFSGIFVIMVIIIIFSSIFTLKVRLLESSIKKVNNQIQDEYKNLQSLKAEWHYLNNPEHLKLMGSKYLQNMKPNYNIDNDKVMKIPLKFESE